MLDKYASEKVRNDVIRPAVKDDAFIGIGSAEAGGGSDVAAFKTTAKKVGNERVLNGEETCISGSEEAKKLRGYFVIARTSTAASESPHRGMTGFYVPINAGGVEVNKRYEDMGRMAISTGGFVMKNTKVPDEYRLGEVDRGFYLTMGGFDTARILISAVCCGASTRALDMGMEYVKVRKAFSRVIGKFQGFSLRWRMIGRILRLCGR